MNQRKCSSCHTWVDAKFEECPNCKTIFYEKEKIDFEVSKKRAYQKIEIPMININSDDSILLKFFKKIIQFHQLMFYGIMYVLGYMAAAFAG